jgi:hypothetical protein
MQELNPSVVAKSCEVAFSSCGSQFPILPFLRCYLVQMSGFLPDSPFFRSWTVRSMRVGLSRFLA